MAAFDITKCVGLDCEMVGYGRHSLLAQVSIVDYNGKTLYNEHVKLPPYADPDKVDYRTQYSGVTKADLAAARYSFTRVQHDVIELLRGKIVVGHALDNDFRALALNPAAYGILDTALIFRQESGKLPSLKQLAATHLHKEIQRGTHDPTEDARTAMELVRMAADTLAAPVGGRPRRQTRQRRRHQRTATRRRG